MSVDHFWQGADPTAQADPELYELGTRLVALGKITVRAIRVWSTGASTLANRRGRLWDIGTGAQLGIAIMPDVLPAGWSEHLLTEPVVVDAATTLMVSYSTQGYGFTIRDLSTVTSADGLLQMSGVANYFSTPPGQIPATPAGSSGFYGVDLGYEAGDTIAPPSEFDPVVTLDVSVSGGQATATYSADMPASFRVDWGDGFSSSGPGPKSHPYVSPGVYAIAVTATATDSGRKSTKAVGVSIVPQRQVDSFEEYPDPTLAVHALIDLWFGQPDAGNPLIGAAAHGEPLLASPASVDAPLVGDADDALPWAQAYAFGGEGGQLESSFVADVHFFADTYHAASLLARRFDARFMGYPHRVSSNGRSVLFDRVESVSVPVEVEWDEHAAVRRFQATYSFSIRR